MLTVIQPWEKVMVHSFKNLQSSGLFPPETKRSSVVVCKRCRTRFEINLQSIKALLKKCTFTKELKKKLPV